MNRYAIECTGIEKTFVQRTIPVTRLQDRLLRLGQTGREIRVEALKPTTVKIGRGEWIGLYGANGSGKTTFLKLVAGLLEPDQGTVIRRGTMSTFFELGIGFHPERPAHENIRLNGLLHGFSPREIDAMTERILDFADIGEFADLPLKCYSTGMRLRLAFAASAHVEADIYLFDEIMAVGDENFQKKCRAYLMDLKARGKTVILVTHNFHELCSLVHRVLFFAGGRVTGQRKKVCFSDSPEPELVWKLRSDQTKEAVSV
jgi:ABC-type polysaccharide/polyol phosphate transport system ATPase subunit